MKIAHRLALSFALLGAVLMAVVAYHGRVIRDFDLRQRELSNDSLQATQAAVRMELSIEDQEEIVRKIIELRRIDEGEFVESYVEKLESLRSQFSSNLNELATRDLSPEESEARDAVAAVWEQRRQIPVDVEALESANGSGAVPGEGVALAEQAGAGDALLPTVARLDDDPEALAIAAELPRIDVDTERALAHLDELRAAVAELLRTVTLETPKMLREEADETSAQLDRTNRLVLVTVFVASLIIWFLTSRAISRPLSALIGGTRAVADGRFEFQLDADGSDEVSRVAAAFNTMARRLEALDRMKKDFVARVSHDLRTPLVSMQETSDLLLAGLTGPLSEKQARLVRLNRESGRRLGGRIANLLALSRIEAGAFELDMKLQDLGELARFVLREVLVPARRRGLDIDLEIPESPLMVRIDGERITQVLENLLDNAIKHTPQGGRIGMRIRPSDASLPESTPGLRRKWPTAGHVEIVVTDSGTGVAEADRDRVFHSFYRADAQPATHGTGLGLAICRDLVEAHGGTIWVDDAADGGARFHVVLPWERTETDATGEMKDVAPDIEERTIDEATLETTV